MSEMQQDNNKLVMFFGISYANVARKITKKKRHLYFVFNTSYLYIKSFPFHCLGLMCFNKTNKMYVLYF